MSLYFAHAMPIYRTHEEKEQLSRIGRRFLDEDIINPAAYSNHPEKRRDTMAFCYKLIDGCEILVFSRWRGMITSGVGQEVNYALEHGKKVFELVSGRFMQITKPVTHLSFEETVRLYYGDRFNSQSSL